MVKLPQVPSEYLWYYNKCKGFYHFAKGSIIIVLPHLVIDSDLTDIYIHENLPDYHFKADTSHSAT